MTRSQLLAAVLALGGAACAHPASQPRVVGPVIGESTAEGPRDPTRPPPAPGGVTEVSAPIHGTPSPVANPAITVDTMPSTLEPSGNSSTTSGNAPVTVFSGVGTGTAPVGATTGAAGPNGPGTGNGTANPTGPATGGASPGQVNAPTLTPTTPPVTPRSPSSPPSVTPTTPGAPSPSPAAPTTPSNGPGTGNTINRPVTPIAPSPAPAPVSPR